MKLICFILLCLLPNSINSALHTYKVEFVPKKEPCIEISTPPVRALSIDDSIRVTLREYHLNDTTIELIVAQAKHESGNYKNKLTKEHNNIFSRLHHKSDTLSLGPYGYAEGRKGYASYRSIRDATISQVSYFKRLKYSMNWTSSYAFAAELKKKRYYYDPKLTKKEDIRKYARALRKHFKPPICDNV